MTTGNEPERKSAERIAFEYYLRTSRRLPSSLRTGGQERKFNPYHDERGRFTFAPGGINLAPDKPGAVTPGQKQPQKLKSVNGYPENGNDAWRSANDSLFIQVANEFNQRNDLKPGDPRYVDPQMMKAWAMVESGGDKKAFLSDPFQVNNPGDWADAKSEVGLQKGQTMTPKTSANAALQWLDRKGHLTTQLPKGKYVTRYVGLARALQRYNGNTKIDKNGKPHYENYANAILSLM